MQTAPQQISVEATAILTVKLQAQQWNVVLKQLYKGRIDRLGMLTGMINEQLAHQMQEQAAQSPASPPGTNGVDHSELPNG